MGRQPQEVSLLPESHSLQQFSTTAAAAAGGASSGSSSRPVAPPASAGASAAGGSREWSGAWMFRRGGSKAHGSHKASSKSGDLTRHADSSPLLASPSIDHTPSDALAHSHSQGLEKRDFEGDLTLPPASSTGVTLGTGRESKGSEGGGWRGGKKEAVVVVSPEYPTAKGLVFISGTYAGELKVFQNFSHPVKQ